MNVGMVAVLRPHDKSSRWSLNKSILLAGHPQEGLDHLSAARNVKGHLQIDEGSKCPNVLQRDMMECHAILDFHLQYVRNTQTLQIPQSHLRPWTSPFALVPEWLLPDGRQTMRKLYQDPGQLMPNL